MKIGIGNNAKVLVLFAMKVEGQSITTNEPWVLAKSSRQIASYTCEQFNCQLAQKKMRENENKKVDGFL